MRRLRSYADANGEISPRPNTPLSKRDPVTLIGGPLATVLVRQLRNVNDIFVIDENTKFYENMTMSREKD